jgi:hypothetical protein
MTAYFVFKQPDPQDQEHEFVFALHDEARIAEARAILRDPQNPRRQVQGTIVPARVPYNPAWSFHLDPDSIGFFELAAEVCDANVTWVEENLEAIGGSALPGNHWCPWSSKLDREVVPSVFASSGGVVR